MKQLSQCGCGWKKRGEKRKWAFGAHWAHIIIVCATRVILDTHSFACGCIHEYLLTSSFTLVLMKLFTLNILAEHIFIKQFLFEMHEEKLLNVLLHVQETRSHYRHTHFTTIAVHFRSFRNGAVMIHLCASHEMNCFQLISIVIMIAIFLRWH